MKSKLTLSINKAQVIALRKASARRGKSISALVEEMAVRLEKEDREDAPIPEWLSEMGTWLKGKITEEDLRNDPRLAHAYGYKPDHAASSTRKPNK